jgi:predicted tellurium resistance membrane protein TerC
LGFQVADLVTIALLVVLEGLLSADNAMVLAVLVLGLPRADQRKALPYNHFTAHDDAQGRRRPKPATSWLGLSPFWSTVAKVELTDIVLPSTPFWWRWPCLTNCG